MGESSKAASKADGNTSTQEQPNRNVGTPKYANACKGSNNSIWVDEKILIFNSERVEARSKMETSRCAASNTKRKNSKHATPRTKIKGSTHATSRSNEDGSNLVKSQINKTSSKRKNPCGNKILSEVVEAETNIIISTFAVPRTDAIRSD